MQSVKSIIVGLFLSLLSHTALAAPVNVNTADAATLADSLKGIGPSLARAIVDYRTANGPFKSVEDLTNIRGIGPKVVERNRTDIRLRDPARKGK